MSKRRRFSGELKAKIALEALRGDRMLQEIASKHQVHPNQVSAWKRQAIAGLGEVFSNGSERRRRDHESEVRELHAKIGELTVERDFFIERVRSMSRAERRVLVRRARPELSVSRPCRLLSVGRSSLYYTTRGESEETLALMRRIDALFLKHPFYGTRQMVRHLRREGVRIGRRRAGRLMRLLGRQAIYRAPRLSAPHPAHRVYPYLLKGLTIERANQVWCADITYIPVRCGGLYLVAIMDWRASMCWPGDCRTPSTRASASTPATPRWPAMARRKSSTPTRAASSRAAPSPGACRPPASRSRWTAGAGAWTTSLSSGCGVRSNTRPSICMSSPTASRPGASSASGSASTRPSGHTRRSAGERQPRPTAAPGLWI